MGEKLGRRVGSLEATRQNPAPAPASGFDPTLLTLEEQAELDDLVRRLGPLPGERCSLAPRSNEQFERAHELVRKGHGLAEGPA